MKAHWHPIEHIELLENGEAFYPRVFEAIACARSEVLIETFILFEDKVGWALHAVLLEAARRGVQVVLTVDGFGSCDLGESYVAPLTAAGVRVQFFDRRPRLLGMRLHAFRRLHRKIVVVDGAQAFIGGINFCAEHLRSHGIAVMQDLPGVGENFQDHQDVLVIAKSQKLDLFGWSLAALPWMLASPFQFYLSRRGFTDTSPAIVSAVLEAIGEVDAWAAGHADA